MTKPVLFVFMGILLSTLTPSCHKDPFPCALDKPCTHGDEICSTGAGWGHNGRTLICRQSDAGAGTWKPLDKGAK